LGPGLTIVNLDQLSYAGNLQNLESLRGDPSHIFVQGDIADQDLVDQLLSRHRPQAMINFAAETHVDRSIYGPEAFMQTNVMGTFHLLEAARRFWQGLDGPARQDFRFLHISTDEVYGSLGPDDPPFIEGSPYAPNNPYAASKAAADHLMRAYHHTYGLPTLITNCTNNYGSRQFPEKLIPLMILNAFQGKGLPIYGDGQNIRDWLYVEDHCRAINLVLAKGRVGETYNIGGGGGRTNLEVVHTLCEILDRLGPDSPFAPHARLITFVKDRPGHDHRYGLDIAKIERELGWRPREDLASGLKKTVGWYLEHQDWVTGVQTGAYREWLARHYG
jgi:dTDP-glucose 4,6-dehydratase